MKKENAKITYLSYLYYCNEDIKYINIEYNEFVAIFKKLFEKLNFF